MKQAEVSTGTSSGRFSILGIPVNITTMSATVDTVTKWASETKPRTIFVREVASLMAARQEPRLTSLHEAADLVVPDGMPLVWIGRMRGHGKNIGRTSGGDLVDEVCARSISTGQTHYFFGGKPGVAEEMIARLKQRHHGLNVVGFVSPPMRQIGPDYEPDEEAMSEFASIKAANPDFIWVGISSPKQEYWMHHAAKFVGRGVFLGVGAAFDFHSGRVARAPRWMRNNGLEWLHRLSSEPTRLWYRYLVLAPTFVFLVAKEAAIGRGRSR